MNGIEKIIGQIDADTQREIDGILAHGRADAQAIEAQLTEEARQEAQAILDKGERSAREREERVAGMAQLEGRKRLLAAKQEMIGRAFDRALEKLLELPEEDYVNLLAGLCAKAAVTGRESVVFSARDRDRVGKAVVARANELLAKQAAPRLPEELAASKAGELLNKVVAAGSALLAGTGMLTLAQETRDIRGGCVLCGDGVEVNCAFDTLVRLSRPEVERQVAQVLFDEG